MKFGAQIEQVDVPALRGSNNFRDRTRLLALLNENCLSHAEIARRIGISRERVRQLANKLIGQTGQERKVICKVNRNESKFGETPFGIAAKEHGLEVFWERHHYAWVNGMSCNINKSCYLLGKHTGKKYVSIRRSSVDASIHVYQLPEGGFLILPDEFAPQSQTAFSLKENHANERKGAHSAAHHYRRFIEAWHLFNANREPDSGGDDHGSSAGLPMGSGGETPAHD